MQVGDLLENDDKKISAISGGGVLSQLKVINLLRMGPLFKLAFRRSLA